MLHAYESIQKEHQGRFRTSLDRGRGLIKLGLSQVLKANFTDFSRYRWRNSDRGWEGVWEIRTDLDRGGRG